METINGKIQVPRCWRRLSKVNYCYADENLTTLAIEGHLNMLVEQADHPVAIDDPAAYWDDHRALLGHFDDGVKVLLTIYSDSSEYHIGCFLLPAGDVVKSKAPFESLARVLELQMPQAKYVLEIEWQGDDPYEDGYPDEEWAEQ